MWHKGDRGGRHQTPIDTCTTGFHFGTSGLWKQPAGRGMSKHALSIRRTHQVHADGGMLEVKHNEEALGGSDNTALSQDPEGYLTTIPSSAPHVLSISRAFPQACVGWGWAALELWLRYSDRALSGGSSDSAVTYKCQHPSVFCCHRLRTGWIWRDCSRTAVTLWSCRLSRTGDRCAWRAPRLLSTSVLPRIMNQVNTGILFFINVFSLASSMTAGIAVINLRNSGDQIPARLYQTPSARNCLPVERIPKQKQACLPSWLLSKA